MATGNQNIGRRVVSATTAGGASVDLAILTEGGYGVAVENINGGSNIWFTVSEPGGACPIPTDGGSNNGEYCASSVAGQGTVNVRHDGQFGSVVQLISATPSTYVVSVLGNQFNG